MFQDRFRVPSDSLDTAVKAKDRLYFNDKSFQVRRGWYANGGKRVFDLIVVSLIIAIFLPLLLVVAVLVRRQGKGIIFRHERVGLNGRRFNCLKFRTMVPDAEGRLRDLLQRDPAARLEWEVHHKLDNDPRITRLGNTLRRTSLDELPQLWNVLRGDMSLVGPRPVTPTELVDRYQESADAYMSVRPGITGPWQVSGRNNISYPERVRMDRAYAQSLGLMLDVGILLRTAKVVAGSTGK